MMGRHLGAVAGAVCLGLNAASEVGAQMGVPHAEIELVAESAVWEPGETTWIGLHFDLEPEWHIYWVNPGDSGMPPRSRWTLPEGFSTGEIRWPMPHRIETGALVDYGYEDEVLLPLPLEVPADYDPTEPVTLTADITYLICREVCIPAKAEASLSRGADGGAPSAALFDAARESWPLPLPEGWTVAATGSADEIVLDIETGSSLASAMFFPATQFVIEHAAEQVVVPSPTGATLTLVRYRQAEDLPATLAGVLLAGDEAYEVEVPIAPGQ